MKPSDAGAVVIGSLIVIVGLIVWGYWHFEAAQQPAPSASATRMFSRLPALAQSARPPALRPVRPAWAPPDLSYEVRAVEQVRAVAERDGFSLRRIQCWPEADYVLCGLCFSHPKRYLGTALVKCDAQRCYWPLDVSEAERVGWNGEPECLVKDNE